MDYCISSCFLQSFIIPLSFFFCQDFFVAFCSFPSLPSSKSNVYPVSFHTRYSFLSPHRSFLLLFRQGFFFPFYSFPSLPSSKSNIFRMSFHSRFSSPFPHILFNLSLFQSSYPRLPSVFPPSFPTRLFLPFLFLPLLTFIKV